MILPVFFYWINANNLAAERLVNNMKKQNEITTRQLTFSLVAIVIGSGILSLPRVVAEKGYQNGWLIVIVGSLIPLLSITAILLLFKRFPESDLIDICNIILGKSLGKVLVFFYLIYSLLYSTASIGVFSSVLNTYILPNTPNMVIIIILIAFALYIINGGINVVARFNELSFYMFLPLLLFLIPALKQAEPTFMLPLFSISAKDLVSESLQTSWSFGGLEYLMILYPFVKNKKKAVSSSMLAYVIVTSVYAYVVIVSNIVFGPYAIKNYIWPVLVLLKVTDIQVIERLEFFFILLWIGVAVRPMTNQLFASSYLISKLFSIQKLLKASLIGAVLLFAIQYVFNTLIKSLKLSDIVGIAGIIVGNLFPILLLTLSIVFKKREKCTT